MFAASPNTLLRHLGEGGFESFWPVLESEIAQQRKFFTHFELHEGENACVAAGGAGPGEFSLAARLSLPCLLSGAGPTIPPWVRDEKPRSCC